jgi:hypothetical protein
MVVSSVSLLRLVAALALALALALVVVVLEEGPKGGIELVRSILINKKEVSLRNHLICFPA